MSAVKLIYEMSQVVVKPYDTVTIADGSTVTVTNVHAPRKENGPGRVTVRSANGSSLDYNPAIIGAKWIAG